MWIEKVNTISLLAFLTGLLIGYENYKIRSALYTLKYSLTKKETKPSVTSGNPALIKDQESSSVIEPKSPQLIDWEEAQELRKMNPGKFS